MRFIKKYWEFILFSILIIVSRVPFISKVLYSWDAAQFSLSLEKFDITQHQPHPPGYLFYVGLGKFVNFFLNDSNLSFVFISIITSILTVFVFYKFCELLFGNKKFAFYSTLIFSSLPYFWYYGEVASTYIFDTLFSLLFVYLALLIIRKEKVIYLYCFSMMLGLSGGFRQSLIVLFLMVWVFTVILLLYRKKLNLKHLFFNIITFLLSVATWFVPVILLTGWHAYFELNQFQYQAASEHTSILRSATPEFIYHNIINVLKVTLAAVGVLVLSPILLFFNKKLLLQWKKYWLEIILFILCLGPSFFVYFFIHFGNTGYLMSVSAIITVIFIVPIWFIYSNNRVKKITKYIVAIFLIVSVVWFTQYHTKLLSYNNFSNKVNAKIQRLNLWYGRYSVSWINHFDQIIINNINEVRQFDPEKTVIVCGKGFKYRPNESETQIAASSYDYFRHLEVYLPEYRLIQLFNSNKYQYFDVKNKSQLLPIFSNEIALDQEVDNIIIISDNIDRTELENLIIQTKKISSSQNIYTIDMKDLDKASFWGYIFKNGKL